MYCSSRIQSPANSVRTHQHAARMKRIWEGMLNGHELMAKLQFHGASGEVCHEHNKQRWHAAPQLYASRRHRCDPTPGDNGGRADADLPKAVAVLGRNPFYWRWVLGAPRGSALFWVVPAARSGHRARKVEA